VPVVVLAALLTAWVAPRTSAAHPRRVDRAGVLLGGVLLAAVTFAVVQWGHRGADAAVAAAVVVVVVLLPVFVIVERRTADPMLPPELFRRRGFVGANAVAAAMNLGTLGLLFLLTLYLQTVQGRSAFAAGVAVLPLLAPLCVLAPVAGRLTARWGPRPVMAAGLLLAAPGVAVPALLHADSGYPVLLAGLLLWGSGIGLLTPAVVAAALGAVPPQRAGLASGINNTSRQAGGAIGIAACGALAGTAGQPVRFLWGFHVAGLATAVLFLAATVATLLLVPRAAAPGAG
jgi:DHA2 family methylenomycin A resistance protein-like MFS transporter